MQTTKALMVLGLSAFAVLCGLLAQPPHTVGELAWSQLRLPHPGQTPVRHPGSGQVLRHVIHKVTPPPVQRVPSAELFQGMQRVVSPGTHAVTAVVRTVRIGGDGIARPSGHARSLLRAAAPAKVLVGTAPVHYLTRDGTVYRYIRELAMVATAYNASYAQNGPWGATAALNGAPLTEGMVAVDPTVIPLGTRLYVDGYGPALAADTGSAIVGNRIDLFFDLNSMDTSKFGIQPRKVYILGPQTLP